MISFRSQKKLNKHIKYRKNYIMALRFLQKNVYNKKKKLSYQLIIEKTLKKNYISHKKYSCLITKRDHGIYKFLRVSRGQIKHLFSFNELTGILKSSW
jgi:ribosomal protein S14